jgi:hypothetical protein
VLVPRGGKQYLLHLYRLSAGAALHCPGAHQRRNSVTHSRVVIDEWTGAVYIATHEGLFKGRVLSVPPQDSASGAHRRSAPRQYGIFRFIDGERIRRPAPASVIHCVIGGQPGLVTKHRPGKALAPWSLATRKGTLISHDLRSVRSSPGAISPSTEGSGQQRGCVAIRVSRDGDDVGRARRARA